MGCSSAFPRVNERHCSARRVYYHADIGQRRKKLALAVFYYACVDLASLAKLVLVVFVVALVLLAAGRSGKLRWSDDSEVLVIVAGSS